MDASMGTQDDVGPTGPTASSGQPWPGAVVMVTETVVKQIVAARARAVKPWPRSPAPTGSIGRRSGPGTGTAAIGPERAVRRYRSWIRFGRG